MKDIVNDFVISTENLTKAYKGKKVLDSVNLKVPRNSIFGFLGPNGAGKTTTIKLILNLIRPTGGKCHVFGGDSVRDSLKIKQRTGYLSQDPRFYNDLTARETLRHVARFYYDGPRQELEGHIEDTLALIGLLDVADRPVKGYSGGEIQRLGIGQAYINRPELLILDEPAASLDPIGRHDVLALMAGLRGKTTIFYSTHILDDVQKVSDTVAILDHGRLVAQAPIDELLSGKGNTVFRIVFRGDGTGARDAIRQLPWVSSVSLTSENGSAVLLVGVTDVRKAEESLLSAAMKGGNTAVAEFGRKTCELEDVFMGLVEGKGDEK
jgi:ABC-2 type transport system ATP-binding protein